MSFDELISFYESGEGRKIDEATAEKFFLFTSKGGGWIETGKIVLHNSSSIVLSYEVKSWGGSIRIQSFDTYGEPVGNIRFESYTGDLSFWNQRICLLASDSLFIFRNTEQEWEEEDERDVSAGFKKIQLEFVSFHQGVFIQPMFKYVNPKRRYHQASSDFLREDDLKEFSMEELSVMRNEIFAGYGYIFKSDKWKEYFSKQEWYTPRYENVNSWLTIIEKHNIDLILRLEKQ